MTTSESDAAYDHRSRLNHGDAFLYDMPQADINLCDKLEGTLRLAILKAFRKPDFAKIFRGRYNRCSMEGVISFLPRKEHHETRHTIVPT